MVWYRQQEIWPSSFLVGLVPGCLHTNHRPEHHAMGQPLGCRPLYGFRKEEMAFASGRLNALTLCLDGLGGRYVVVGALSVLEANIC